MPIDPRDLEALRLSYDRSIPATERQARLTALYADPGTPTPPSMVDSGALAVNDPQNSVAPTAATDARAPVNQGLGPAAETAPPSLAAWAQGQQAAEQQQGQQDAAADRARLAGEAAPAHAPSGPAPQTIDSPKYQVTPSPEASPKADLSNVQFAGQPGAPAGGAPPGPEQPHFAPVSYATVGTNAFEPVSQVRKDAVELPKPLLDRWNQATEAGTEAEIRGAEAQAKADQANEGTDQFLAERRARLDQAHAQLVADNNAKIARGVAAHQAAVDAFMKSSDVDPDRWWNSKATGAKILLAIANGVGEAASKIIGGPNSVMEQIQGHINNDIAAQRDNIEKKKAGIDMQGKALDVARQLSDHVETQDLMAQSAEWSAVLAHAKAMRARTQNPVQAAKLDQLIAGSQEKLAGTLAARQQQLQGQVTTAYRFSPQRTVGAGGGSTDLELYWTKEGHKAGLTGKELSAFVGRKMGRGPAGGAQGLTPIEQELGLTEPGNGRGAQQDSIKKANDALDAAAQAVKLADEYEHANLAANKNYTDRQKAVAAEKITNEARGTFQNRILGSAADWAHEESKGQLPNAGFGHATLDSTVTASAEAMRRKAIDNYNAARARLGLPPKSLADLRGQAGTATGFRPTE